MNRKGGGLVGAGSGLHTRSPGAPTTTTLSPLLILSPGDFSQDTIFPSVIVELRAGMKISLIALRGGQAVLLDDLGTAAVRCNTPTVDGVSAAGLVMFAMLGRLGFLCWPSGPCTPGLGGHPRVPDRQVNYACISRCCRHWLLPCVHRPFRIADRQGARRTASRRVRRPCARSVAGGPLSPSPPKYWPPGLLRSTQDHACHLRPSLPGQAGLA